MPLRGLLETISCVDPELGSELAEHVRNLILHSSRKIRRLVFDTTAPTAEYIRNSHGFPQKSRFDCTQAVFEFLSLIIGNGNTSTEYLIAMRLSTGHGPSHGTRREPMAFPQDRLLY